MRMGRVLAGLAWAAAATGAWAQTPPSTVKIGVLTDLSSLYADTNGPGAVDAARMAGEDYLAAGGRIRAEVIAADHQNKPDIGSAITREWFDQGGVDMVLDVPNSAVGLAVTELATQKNKVFMNSGGSSSDFTGKACSPNSIHWTYDTYALATGTTRAVVAAGGDSWFLLTADYAFGHTMEGDIRKILAETGAKVVGGARAGPVCLDSSPRILGGFLPGCGDRGALCFGRRAGRAEPDQSGGQNAGEGHAALAMICAPA